MRFFLNKKNMLWEKYLEENCLWEKVYYAHGIQKFSFISSLEIDVIHHAWFAYEIIKYLYWEQCRRSRLNKHDIFYLRTQNVIKNIQYRVSLYTHIREIFLSFPAHFLINWPINCEPTFGVCTSVWVFFTSTFIHLNVNGNFFDKELFWLRIQFLSVFFEHSF